MSDHFKTRRRILRGALAVGLAPIAVGSIGSKAHASERNLNVAFTHGVASGDPLANRVILWTRAVAEGASESFYLYWSISERSDMRRPVAGGLLLASPDSDWC
jgi:alkaline phosphatase D